MNEQERAALVARLQEMHDSLAECARAGIPVQADAAWLMPDLADAIAAISAFPSGGAEGPTRGDAFWAGYRTWPAVEGNDERARRVLAEWLKPVTALYAEPAKEQP